MLQELQYLDSSNTVQLKGRVACEMGSNELIVTELVFNNQLTERPPEEIAALLSCLVFQQRNCSAPELTDSLAKGAEDIKVRNIYCEANTRIALPFSLYFIF